MPRPNFLLKILPSFFKKLCIFFKSTQTRLQTGSLQSPWVQCQSEWCLGTAPKKRPNEDICIASLCFSEGFPISKQFYRPMSLSMFLPFPLIYCPSRHQTQSVRAWLCSDPSVECRLLQSRNSLPYCSSHSCFFDSLIMLPSIRAQPPRNLRRSRNSLREKGNRAEV